MEKNARPERLKMFAWTDYLAHDRRLVLVVYGEGFSLKSLSGASLEKSPQLIVDGTDTVPLLT